MDSPVQFPWNLPVKPGIRKVSRVNYEILPLQGQCQNPGECRERLCDNPNCKPKG